MGRVYKDTRDMLNWMKVDIVMESTGPVYYVYLDGKKVGRIRGNEKIRTTVEMLKEPPLDENQAAEPFAYTSLDQLSIPKAFIHYFKGSGKDLTVDSDEVYIGLEPRDFTGVKGDTRYPPFKDSIDSMYRQHGTLDVDTKISRDVGGWAGHVTFRLKGTIRSNYFEWKFAGYVKPFNDEFDFNALPAGERKKWAEKITEFIRDLDLGKPYKIKFEGERKVTDNGRW